MMEGKTDLDLLAAQLAASSPKAQTPEPSESPQGQASGTPGVGEESGQGAGQPEASTKEDDLTADPRFRRWQSTYDKKIAELEATIRRLQSQSSTAPTSNRDDLASTYAELEQQYQQALSNNNAAEAVNIGLRMSKIAERIFEIDLAQKAQEYGLDFNSVRPLAVAARDRGEVYDPATLDAFLLKHAYEQARGSYRQRENELAERESALAQREKELDRLIQEQVQKAVAETLQRMGLTDMPNLPSGTKRPDVDLSKATSVFEALTILTEATNA